MIRIAELHSDTNVNSHTVRKIIYIIIILLNLIDIEMLFAVRFATKRENQYLNRCCDINKENVQIKLIIYYNKFI
jgi:hypothetical protein